MVLQRDAGRFDTEAKANWKWPIPSLQRSAIPPEENCINTDNFDPKLQSIISLIGDLLLLTRKVSKPNDNQSEKSSGSLRSCVNSVGPFGSSQPCCWSVGRIEQKTELFAKATDSGVFGLFNSSSNVL